MPASSLGTAAQCTPDYVPKFTYLVRRTTKSQKNEKGTAKDAKSAKPKRQDMDAK